MKSFCLTLVSAIYIPPTGSNHISRCSCIYIIFCFLKRRFYLFIFRAGEGSRKGEKHQCVVASQTPPTGDPARNQGMCPDWELNQRPFGSQACAQCTELCQPGLYDLFDALLYLFCQYFVENLSIYAHQGYWPTFSFFVVSFSGFGIRIMLASENEFGSLPSS